MKPLTTSFDINGIEHPVEYFDADSFDHLDRSKITQVYGVCFVGHEVVIGLHAKDGSWSIIGGRPEAGETLEQALRREVKEESNMKILDFKPIGYQSITNPETGEVVYQLRYMCTVEPLGEFTGDTGHTQPGEGILEIKRIDPEIYREYFDWGEIGEHIMLRAVDLKDGLLLK